MPAVGLEPGGWAELQGLKSRPELNGTQARVIRWSEERQRWQVLSLKASEVLCVKPEALRGSDRESDTSDNQAAAAAILTDIRRINEVSAPPAVRSRIPGVPRLMSQDAAVSVAEGVMARGYHVTDGILDAGQCAALGREIDGMLQQGMLTSEGHVFERRRDVCFHLPADGAPPSAPELRAALQRLWGAATELVSVGLFAGEQLRVHPEAQLAVFPGGGTYYRAHRDAPQEPCADDVTSGEELADFLVAAQTSPRRATLMLYLNAPEWDSAAGGHLRLHIGARSSDSTGETAQRCVDVAPQGGRFVAFDSRSMLHEVLPTSKRRAALTVWLLTHSAEVSC